MTDFDFSDKSHLRLSDRILFALEKALEQEDIEVSEQLINALDLSMTRNTGGGEFVERRVYPSDIDKAMEKLNTIRAQKKNM
ncbi:MAG: hypothetical protein QF692_08110 [Alphaproteobacteria bacterium]|nr:hypothetical protein [Alphaproteobacteria bacterium]MDP7223208.1 hypothetical protein [Alphaproteobacteria bacterium]